MKIIIESSIGENPLEYVKRVMDKGMISEGIHGEQYCAATLLDGEVRIFASKTKSGTHVFKVQSESNKNYKGDLCKGKQI